MENKLRLMFLMMLLIPQGVMFGMSYDTLLSANKAFSHIEAVTLASVLMLVMIMPSVTVQWLVSKPFESMRQLCYQVKRGNYRESLSLPNESRYEEDDMMILMRDMNWMARQIELRERDLRKTAEDLWQSRNHMDEQNKMLHAVNTELLAVQEILKERTTQLERSCSRMQVMTMTDPLTTIANRRCFFEALEREFTERVCNHCPISLFIIDIDFFKTINDTYGHQAGDAVLLELARIIQSNAREGDLAA